jgi:hypothetical protein
MRKFFCKTIFLHTLRRYWAGSAILTIIFILITLGYHSGISTIRTHTNYTPEQAVFNAAAILQGMLPAILLLAAAAAVACAFFTFSTLHSKRGAVMMHSIPVRREAHYISASLGGLTLLWAPITVCVIGFLIVQLSVGVFSALSLAIVLMMLLLTSFMAYSLSVLAAFLTGSSIGQFSILGLILALPPLVESFFNEIMRNYLFGYGGFSMWFNENFHPVAPIARLTGRTGFWLHNPDVAEWGGFTSGDALQLLFALGFCAVFAVSALLLCRKRRIESAGDLIAFRGVRPVFRYGAAFLAAFIFSMFGSAFLAGGHYYSAMGRVSAPGFLIYGAVGGVIGFFVAEMFLRKTVKVFKHWRGALLFTGCYIAVILALIYDVFGYGSYVLPKDRVESIYLSERQMPWPGSAEWQIEPTPYLFTGDDMSAALALQELIAKEGKAVTREWESWRPQQPGTRTYYGHGSYSYAQPMPYTWHVFHLNATLSSGRVIQRQYRLLLPLGSNKWTEALAALDEAARPQRLERLRNIGAASRYLHFHSLVYFPEWAGMEDFEYNEHPGYTEYFTIVNRAEIQEFFDALVLDNEKSLTWDGFNRWHDYSVHNIMSIQAVLREANPGRNSIHMELKSGDQNAINWLIERGYLPPGFPESRESNRMR